jgi:hypothetical protein
VHRPAPDPLAALIARPAVADAVDRARQACTELRWHPALRRRIPEVRTEACVRAAAASAELDGVRLPLEQVRAMVGGLSAPTDPRDAGGRDPVEAAVRGALRANLACHDLARTLGRSPAQVLAQLHTLAAADLVAGAAAADTLGRPQPGTAPRVEGLTRLLAGATDAPGLVVAAVADAECTVTEAFAPAAGVTARALARTVVVSAGLDPHGVVVPERHALADRAGRQAALEGYRSGSADGVEAWVLWWGEAVVAGAAHGRAVADEVLAGRLA